MTIHDKPHSNSDRAENFQPPKSVDSPKLADQAHHLLSTSEGRVHQLHHTSAQTDAQKPAEKQVLPHLQITGLKNNEAAPLDARKPVSELVKSGVIVDKTADLAGEKSERRLEAKSAYDKSPPKISVGMENIDGSPQPKAKPLFTIQEDGRIEMSGDPEKLHPKDISIVLARKEGQLGPTDAQSKAADGLVKYLAERTQATNGQARRGGMELDDRDNVISRDVEKREKLHSGKDLQNVTPETRRSVQQTHRFHGANGVDMPAAQTERMGSFGTRDVPRLSGETGKTMGIKEAVAGLWKPDRQEPYETARKHPDGGYRVGRYGFSGHQIHGFLKGLGEPPDPALIEKMIKEGKLPKDFAENLKDPEFLAKLNALADKMDKGEQPDKNEIRALLPKKAQEAMESGMIDGAKKQVGDKPGDIAAGLLTGKATSDLSKADLSTPEGKQLSEAGGRLYDMATERRHTEMAVSGRIPQGQKRELIETALTAADVPVTAANVAAVNLIVQKESSWNPNIVNHWDSNARKGTPSKGLMQTIGPTFNSYSIPGHKNILDPVDNMIAGIRYSVDRYGSLSNVPGVRAVNRGARYRGY